MSHITKDGTPGLGSKEKFVNDLLCGIHLCAAAEAMVLGVGAGLDPRVLFDIISNAAGNSWAFENKVPHMLDADYTPTSSTLDILLKDFGLIMEEAKALRFPLPLGSMAHQQFLLASACGFGHEDDAAIVKVVHSLSFILGFFDTKSHSVEEGKASMNNFLGFVIF